MHPQRAAPVKPIFLTVVSDDHIPRSITAKSGSNVRFCVMDACNALRVPYEPTLGLEKQGSGNSPSFWIPVSWKFPVKGVPPGSILRLGHAPQPEHQSNVDGAFRIRGSIEGEADNWTVWVSSGAFASTIVRAIFLAHGDANVPGFWDIFLNDGFGETKIDPSQNVGDVVPRNGRVVLKRQVPGEALEDPRRHYGVAKGKAKQRPPVRYRDEEQDFQDEMLEDPRRHSSATRGKAKQRPTTKHRDEEQDFPDEMLENPGKAPSVSRAKVSERHVRPTLAMPREAMYVIYEGKHYPIDAVVTGQQFLQELALKPPVQGSRPQLVLIDQEGSDIGIVPLDEPLCDLGVGGWRVNVQWMETAK